MEWFYERLGKQVGPVTEEALRELVRNGPLGAENHVWCAAFGREWKRIADVPELKSELPPLAPNAELQPDTPNYVLMARAREALRGKWGVAVLMFVVYMIITIPLGLVLNLPFRGLKFLVPELQVIDDYFALAYLKGQVQSLFIAIPIGALIVGYCFFHLNMARRRNPRLGDLFAFYPTAFWRCGLAHFWMTLFIFLWTLLLVIPGIMAAFSYSQTYYILMDNPELSPREAIAKSKRMMHGVRWKLFYLHCGFIGWGLLCLLTCGIGLLWLSPYIQTSLANFYESVKSRA